MAMFVGISMYVLFAFLVAVVCILVGAMLLHASNRRTDVFFAPIFGLLVFVGIIDAALSHRLLDPISIATGAAANWMAGATKLPSKLLLGVLIGVCICAIVSWLLRVKDRIPIASPALLAGFLALYMGSTLLPAALGAHPKFHIALFYAPIVVPALFTALPEDNQRLIAAIKFSLGAIVVASLLATLALPTTALQKGYHGLVPGLHTRLWGLASHANVLGPVALTFLIFEWSYPWKNRFLHVVMLGLAGVAMMWTQSRTTVIAAAVAFAILAVFRVMGRVRRSWEGDTEATPIAAGFAGALLIAPVALGLALLFSVDFWHVINRVLESGALGQIETASGRTAIWNAAIAEGVKHPLFGYGPEMWGDDYRRATGLYSAFYAHNQVLQAFSVGGGVAVFGLLVYLTALVTASFKVARHTRGVSLALLSVLIVRAVTEVPMQITAISGGDFVAHLAFLFYVAIHVRELRQPAATTSRIERDIEAVPAT